MRKRWPKTEPDDERWQWDMVTWIFIVLIATAVICLFSFFWHPHPFPVVR